jgi:predicted lactoylglutathione lyase
MVHPRISLVTIGAIDLSVLRSFYQKLGWQETEFSNHQFSVFRTAGVMLALFPLTELAKDAQISLDGWNQENIAQNQIRISKIALAINVDTPDEVDEMIQLISDSGGQILRACQQCVLGRTNSILLRPRTQPVGSCLESVSCF